MKLDVEDVSSVKKKINVVMPSEKVGSKIDLAYKRLGKSVKINGFRPGKAPRRMLEKEYGDRVLDEVLDGILKESYPEIIQKSEIAPVAYPEFGGEKITVGEDFAFTLLVDVKPKIDPKGYDGVSIKEKKVKVSDKDVIAELEKLQKSFATLVDVEGRAIEKGDLVTFDFEGFVDGEPLANAKADDSKLEIGSGQFIPGFEDGMIGMSKDEKGEVKANFPDDYHEKGIAGKEAVFKVFIKDIKTPKLPELDDEFAKSVGDYKTIEDLKKRTKEDLENAAKENSKKEMQQEIVDILLKENSFEVPDSMVEGQARHKAEETKKQMAGYGMPEDAIAKQLETMSADIFKNAKKQVETALILESIAAKEKLEVKDEDIDKYFDDMADKSGRPVSEIKGYFEDKKEYLKETLMDNKVIDLLMSKAKIS